MKTYAILYYDFSGDVAMITVPGLNATDARDYALNHYSHLIVENSIIKVVKV